MKRLGSRTQFGVIVVLVATLASCSPARSELPAAAVSPSPQSVQPTVTTYTDPFAYCEALGAIDEPDARFVGPRVPESIARGLQAAFGLPSDAPLSPPFVENSFWRCMNGKVYACTVGANLPCQAKADTSTSPSAATLEYCRTNPEAEIIPAAVTGRATIYQWRCTSGQPTTVREVTRADERGYLANIWHEIKHE